MLDAQSRGDGTAVTAVPVEQLHNPDRLAELTRALKCLLVGYWVDQPDLPPGRDGVRRPLHETRLGRDPTECETELIDEADPAHLTDGTWRSPSATARSAGDRQRLLQISMISHGLGATPPGDVGVPFLRDSSDGYGYERGFARNPRRSITVGVAEWLFDRMHAR